MCFNFTYADGETPAPQKVKQESHPEGWKYCTLYIGPDGKTIHGAGDLLTYKRIMRTIVVSEKLEKLALAYKKALECDYCKSGKYQGLRPDELSSRIVDNILKEKNNVDEIQKEKNDVQNR